MSLAAMANGGNGVIKRQALALKNDLDGGKYIAGMKEIRVRTREEAHAIFKLGQIDRQVFGTGQNQRSSRSHGILTVKIVKIHNGAPNVSIPRDSIPSADKAIDTQDPESAQVSRLSIVDLAGSERTKNTHNAGDRLREAANINTSLMVSRSAGLSPMANCSDLDSGTMHGNSPSESSTTHGQEHAGEEETSHRSLPTFQVDGNVPGLLCGPGSSSKCIYWNCAGQLMRETLGDDRSCQPL